MRLLLILLAVAAHGVSFAATLTGTVVNSTATVNLAAVGTLDWARWPGYSHKANFISNVTITGQNGTYDGDPRIIGNRLGIRTSGSNASFQFTVQATTTERTLIYYVGGRDNTSRITVSLPGAPDFTTTFSGTTTYSKVVTIRYRADAAATLGVRFQVVSGSGSIRMQAAALQGAGTAPTNRAPVISGTAPTIAVQGQAYSFTPTASDADGNPLTFSIANRPGWATFNSTTGRLSGTPSLSNVGPYGNIVISVSDGRASASLASFTLTVVAANRAPIISGTPPATVLVGNSYAFTPTSSDPDGNTLRFTAVNLPGWATINSATGRIAGTPTAANVGTYGNIRVSVSDGALTASLSAFSIQVVGTATGSALLSWTPPTRNTDGTVLTDLAGFRVYWGTVAGTYPNSVTIQNPGLSSYVVDQLTPGTWYFVTSAVNTRGTESALTPPRSKTIQ
jgi:hypothetical protein